MSEASTSPEQNAPDFRQIRQLRALNLVLQVTLTLTLAVMLNYIAAHHYQRYDLTESRRYTLSPETRHYLTNLDREIDVYVLMPRESENGSVEKIREDLDKLLREYAHASRQDGVAQVRTEFVDVFRQRARAHELSQRFNITQEATIIVASGERYREILGTDLYVTREGTPVAFRGETVFTEAMLDVTRDNSARVYFILGHGEMRPDDTNPVSGLSQLGQFLSQRNIEIRELDLTSVAEIPEDADLLVLAAPQRPLRPSEEDALRIYLSEGNGKLIVFLKPGSPAGIDELLYDWGVLSDSMAVVGVGKDYQAQGGDLIVRHFAEHPITDFLVENRLPVIMGLSQSVRPDPGAPIDERRETTSLMASAGVDNETGQLLSWAEPYWGLSGKVEYNPDIDLPGPVSVATVSQRRVDSGLGLNIPGGKLAVFGNADFAANNYFQSLGNSVLLNNVFNWTLERNSQLKIPPRKIPTYSLTMSRAETRSIMLRLLILPVVLGTFGGMVIWRRRH